MEYFRILNLKKEPFSNSPEPDFFYSSVQHRSCLQQLELAIHLHRGLNVVIGDVGTGKTTICRQLILKFAHPEEGEDHIKTHLLMDPAFSTPLEFLTLVATSFGIDIKNPDATEWQIKEEIKQYLFEYCVGGGDTIVLIIDEGQKLPDFCLEILREFLNYETNEQKLLQIVIFAQKEFQDIVRKYPNFQDRVNQFYFLEPLSFRDTRKMIEYRIAKASDYDQIPKLFTLSGLWGVYHYTGGYPRKIITLCHQVMLTLIIQNKSKADLLLIRSCAKRVSTEKVPSLAYQLSLVLIGLLIFIAGGLWFYDDIQPAIDAKAIESSIQAEKGRNQVAAVENMAKPGKENVSGEVISIIKERPEILGVLKVEQGNAVYRILEEVYGNYDGALIDAFKKMNPHIKNINMVLQGDSVKIPAVAARKNPLYGKGCRVQLSAKSTLNDALNYIRSYPQDLPLVRLLPYWNKKEGLIFAVLMSKNFESDEEALSIIKEASSPYLKSGEVICKWAEGTEFYGR